LHRQQGKTAHRKENGVRDGVAGLGQDVNTHVGQVSRLCAAGGYGDIPQIHHKEKSYIRAGIKLSGLKYGHDLQTPILQNASMFNILNTNEHSEIPTK
jgi:hypothetical protein